MVEERLVTGMLYIPEYSELAAALMGPVCGYITPDLSSVVDQLKEKVGELVIATQRTAQNVAEESHDEIGMDGEASNDSDELLFPDYVLIYLLTQSDFPGLRLG